LLALALALQGVDGVVATFGGFIVAQVEGVSVIWRSADLLPSVVPAGDIDSAGWDQEVPQDGLLVRR
jgi:hypothetical protein